MKIMVTGGAGFIGSNITDAYISAGHEVTVVDDLSTGKEKNLNPKAKFYKTDINNPSVEGIFKDGRFEVVNNHAAQIDVRKSVADPLFDAKINILGSVHLLENCRKYNVKKFIFASSGGTIYGECNETPPDEKAPKNPMSPYGIAKLVVEYYMNYYSEVFKINTVSMRYGNVYGPRQDPHGEAGVVAIFSLRMLSNEDVLIFGDGGQLRDYVYIDDVVRANLAALDLSESTVVNIGTGAATSVNQLFEILKKASGYPGKPVYKPPRTGELFKSFLDIKKAKEKLNWGPKTDIESGLERTFEYFKKTGRAGDDTGREKVK